jgi:aspartyl-tRNA synthetase
VVERQSKNANMPTGEVEIFCTALKVLNSAKTPPFTIEDETDGGDELRMKYRYLDLRRNADWATSLLPRDLADFYRGRVDPQDLRQDRLDHLLTRIENL